MNSEALMEMERYLHQRIPLTRAMGLRVVADSSAIFALEAPVALNSNHLETAFGASINAVATLAGYGFLWLELRKENAHVVIASSSIHFLQPIREMIRAHCVSPAADEIAGFKARLRERGKARIALRVEVSDSAGKPAAIFRAEFVALAEDAE